MRIETLLMHDYGQFLHHGDPLYHGAQLMGYFKGIHDDVNEVVNVERPNGGGVRTFHIDVMKTWDTRPATDSARTNGQPDSLNDPILFIGDELDNPPPDYKAMSDADAEMDFEVVARFAEVGMQMTSWKDAQSILAAIRAWAKGRKKLHKVPF